MEEVINIIASKDSVENDKKYWRGKTPQERLEALEFLCQQYSIAINAPEILHRIFENY